MEGVCATCLTVGRRLAPLKIDASTVSSWFGVNIADPICWECQATLFRFISFRNRVIAAQDTLQKHEAKFLSLSQLSYVSKDSYDEIIMQGIKTEVIDCPIEFNHIHTDEYNVQNVKIENDSTSLPAGNCETVVTNTCSDEITEVFKSEVLDYVVDCSERDNTDDDDEQNDKVKKYSNCLPANYCKTVVQHNIDKLKNIKENPEMLSSDYYKIKKLTMVEVKQIRKDNLAAERYLKYSYRCQTCIVCFQSESKLETHNSRLHSEESGSHICSICLQRFQRKDILMNHYNAHFKCYVCLHCDLAHPSYDLIYAHYLKKHFKGGWQCDVCPTDCVFPTRGQLRYHYRTMHQKHPICPIADCGKTFKTKDILKKHMLLHNGGTPRLECTICHKQVKGESNFKNHMKRHTDPPPPPTELAYCVTCKRQFNSRLNYDKHLKYAAPHRNPNVLKFECAHCGKLYVNKHYLKDHVLCVHLNRREFVCNVCNKTFNTIGLLNRHHKTKCDELRKKIRDKVCEQCGKAFILKKTLDEHLNSHTGARPYECQVCGDRFSRSSALFNHNRLKHENFKRKKRCKN